MTENLSADLASLRIDRTAPPPSRAWTKALLWILVAGGAAFAYSAGAPYVESKLFKTTVSTTEVALISPAQASVELTASGYVQADLASRVAPKVPGRVIAVHVSQGDLVTAGQPLLALDSSDDKASIVAAQTEASASRAQARSTRARAEVARAELDDAVRRATRERHLADQGATAAASADDLEARAASLQRAVAAAEAEALASEASAKALGARVNVLNTGLKNLVLTAPIDGTVINRPPQLGEYVGPQPPGVLMDMGGIRIADLRSLVVEADIPEARLSQVKPGAPAEIVLDAFPARRYRGQVKQITPLVDRAKATVIVKVAFSDESSGVLPDMSARVSFLTKALDRESLREPPKLVVPSTAISERNGGKVVYVVEEGKVRMVPIELGAPFGSGFELERGPGAGTQLVANPPQGLADGQAVKLQE